MSQWTREEITFAADGRIINAGKTDKFAGFSIDTRRIEPHQIYIALKGEQYDGHSFVADAAAKGVKGLIVENSQVSALESLIIEQDLFCVAVADTRYTLGQIARFHRRWLNAKVLAVTGSAGKTSTRQMISAVLAKKYRLWSTEGNFNNEIGLPLTILGLTGEHDWAVVEMGANHPGEIKRLCEIAEPRIAVITNVGPAHLEGFLTLESVRNAKAEILANIPADGAAIINGDDAMLRTLALNQIPTVLYYGFEAANNIRAEEFELRSNGSRFKVNTPNTAFVINLNVPGNFMAQNALAAIAAGYYLQVSPKDTAAALAEFTGGDKRLEITASKQGVYIINDSYNANPLSMAAAMSVLANAEAARKILVMGSMGELGESAQKMHTEMGELAARYNFDRLYLCGPFVEYTVHGAINGGLPEKNIVWGSREYVMEQLLKDVNEGDCILIKGSRSMQMEDFAAALLK